MAINDAQIVKMATQTIKIEAQTVAALANQLDEDFIAAVHCLFECRGRVIVTGIGKSALIGRKIVATFNSTGTPAIFMHAADAIHGDLGIILPKDVILCLSKSGETAEIKALLPFFKTRGNTLIAITSRKDGYLAAQADFCIHTPVPLEAEPNNLAPTASTTAQMVMGDALATTLLQLRGFDANDFAQLHPGGLLGKQLHLKVSDICHYNDRPEVLETATIRQTILEMTSKRLGCAVVVDNSGTVEGIVTDGDLRRMLEEKEKVAHLCAADIMTPNPKNIQSDALAIAALDLMSEYSITQLVVMEGEAYFGIVHLHDLIREGMVESGKWKVES
ncbi:MAG: KpsF/GutQ family sugar-phosphate isomerase [Bacteroidota bacterium]